MLTYSFTDTEGLSLYEYIYKCIKEDIITGKLTANEKLPSKRVFAKNHGISTVTVENAYGQLMAEGYIYSEPKKGFFVSPIENITTSYIVSVLNIFTSSLCLPLKKGFFLKNPFI